MDEKDEKVNADSDTYTELFKMMGGWLVLVVFIG